MSSQAPHSQSQANSSHPDFKQTEASRPGWDAAAQPRYTKVPNPNWKFGDGANSLAYPSPSAAAAASSSSSQERRAAPHKQHIAIDPYEQGRPVGFNHKLLISAVAPRPIAFISSCAPDGSSENLAPFSYFNLINHDPPLFIVGFSRSLAHPQDSLRNLSSSKECVINIISEHFIEAANAASIDAPYATSEWDVTGLTRDYSCETVKAPRVKEAIFSIEAKLDSLREWESRAAPGKGSGVMAILEGTRFWVREDALNEDKNMVDLAVLRPLGRLGGITYSRTAEVVEIPRPQFENDLGGQEGVDKLIGSKK